MVADWRVGRTGTTGGTKSSDAACKKSAHHSLTEEKGGERWGGGAKSDVAGCIAECSSLTEEERRCLRDWIERRQQKCGRHCRQLRAISPLIRMCDLLSVFEHKNFYLFISIYAVFYKKISVHVGPYVEMSQS